MADIMFFRIELSDYFQEYRLKKKKVFIVHGHDEIATRDVEMFIEKLDLIPVVLRNQPNAGSTLIGKLEKEARVPFAVVLMTPDDKGYSIRQPKEVKPRARQNIIFELGYFIGRIGRDRVAALYKGGVELPSDLHGFVYISMENGDEWKRPLAKELKHAGLKVNIDRAFL